MATFEDDNHALQTGMLIGALMKAGVNARPTVNSVDDYTPIIAVEIPLSVEAGNFVTIYVRVLSEGEG